MAKKKPKTCPLPLADVDEGQIDALRKDMDRKAEEDPRYIQLFDLLLSHGGLAVVPSDEPHLEAIVKWGFTQKDGRAKKAAGRPINCHANSAILWSKKPDTLAIVTGWALSDDGVWRQHTWVRERKSGRIHETTVPRILYFGVELTPEEAEHFYDVNVKEAA